MLFWLEKGILLGLWEAAEKIGVNRRRSISKGDLEGTRTRGSIYKWFITLGKRWTKAAHVALGLRTNRREEFLRELPENTKLLKYLTQWFQRVFLPNVFII